MLMEFWLEDQEDNNEDAFPKAKFSDLIILILR
jgi:hypothetical protein